MNEKKVRRFDMSAIAIEIEKIILNPVKKPSKEEARSTLQELGIIDSEGNIQPRYQGIVEKKEPSNNGKN